jgi:uncharacterized protein YbjT (DUF2867 family)
MKKTAIILGASGATGTELLKLLLVDDRYKTIKLFSRKKSHVAHLKIKEYIGDLFNLNAFAEDFIADEVYCCIGTTQKQTPDENLYRKIDFGIPIAAAQLSKQNNIPTFLIISSIGANANSNTFYTKTKGEMENEVSKTFIKRTFIFRPSLLLRNTKESRFFESLAGEVMTRISFLFMGSLKKYRAIKTETVALAMIRTANSNKKSKRFLSDEIQHIGS